MSDNYDLWNHAILFYFIEGAQRGTSIFLSVDDDIIPQIGRELDVTKERSLHTFCSAVRQRVLKGDRIKLSMVEGRNDFGEPNGVAFLAAMVLAASRMAEGDLTSHLNYFKRLREVFDLSPEEGRPRGMDAGTEVPLWEEWALWLQEHGFLPSAYEGDGPTKFTSYPISQTLLRRTDKDRLRKLFEEKNWHQDWNVDMLLKVRREGASLSQHLRELLNSDGLRFQAAAEAIYDFYEDWQNDPQLGQAHGGASRIPHLSLGLYRTEDLLRGNVEYFLYPHVPRRHRAEQIRVWFLGTLCTLTRERPGWYSPIGPIRGEELDQGSQYLIEPPSDFDAFILPQRQFWILISDPDNPDANVYATWGVPTEIPILGSPFIVLCHKELVPQLERLKGERLINWSDKPNPLPENDRWVEIRDCMIILQDWSGIRIENQQLYDALRPKQSMSISMSGGLRAPALGGWIEGYGPQLTIFGFEPQVNVKVIRVRDNHTIVELLTTVNEPFSIEWPEPGDYRVDAFCAGGEAKRLVKIISWDQLHISPPQKEEAIKLNGLRIRGAFIEE